MYASTSPFTVVCSLNLIGEILEGMFMHHNTITILCKGEET